MSVDHCRDALIHVLVHWKGMASSVPGGLNVVQAAKASRALNNMASWLTSTAPSTHAVTAFYDREVDHDKMAPLLALVAVCAAGAAMPNWGLAAMQAIDLDKAIDGLLDVMCDNPNQRETTHKTLQAVARQKAGHLMGELRVVQDSAPVDTAVAFGSTDGEADLLRRLHDTAIFSMRSMLLACPALAYDTRTALRDFASHCTRKLEMTASEEPLAVRLLVQVHELVNASDNRLSAMEDTINKLDVRVTTAGDRTTEAVATALTAEHLAEGLVDKVDKLHKVRVVDPKRLAERLAAVEDAVDEARTRATAAEARATAAEAKAAAAEASATAAEAKAAAAEARAEAAEVKAARATTESRLRAQRPPVDVKRLEAVVTGIETVVTSMTSRLDEASARLGAADEASARLGAQLGARLGAVEAAVSARGAAAEDSSASARLERRVDWLVGVVQRHFVNRWNAVHAEWAQMQSDMPLVPL